jgi:hypothetical protein
MAGRMGGAPRGVAGGDREIPAETLVSIADEANYAIDRRVLKTLVREGVLQRGRQVHIHGQPGSRTMYPAAAAEQLLLVLPLRERERRFDLLRCKVWWQGGWVDHTLLRHSILRRLDAAGLADVHRLTEMYPDPIDAAEYLVDQLRSHPSRSPVVRLLQRNLRDRGGRWEVAAHLLIQLALGGEPIWDAVDVGLEEPEPAPVDLVRSAGGFERARFDTVTVAGATLGPILPIQTPLAKLVERFVDGGWLPITRWPEIVIQASDRELDQARDDTRAIIEPLVTFVQALEALAARGGLGLALLTRLERATDADFPLLWVPYWIVWRRTSAAWERRNLRYLAGALALGAPAARVIIDRAHAAQNSA